jgi:4a-hydroxytetrahydrobiopterin dehydratase
MNALSEKKCSLCEGGTSPLSLGEAQKLLNQIPGWEIDKTGKKISKKYSFKGFYPTMSFINAVAYIAQQEGHHPDISFGYNYCHISFMTHAIDGLSENDFICAAKINELMA